MAQNAEEVGPHRLTRRRPSGDCCKKPKERDDMADLIVSTLTQGLIFALLSYGVYITYSVLDFPDLTVDSSFPLGAAVTAILLLQGVNPWVTLLCAAGAGAIAGLCTGLIHVKLKVRDLLAGIITMTALSSINLVLAGSNVTVERAVDTIFTSPLTMALFGDLSLTARKLILSLVLAVVVKLILDLYFRTKSGLLLRATGDNGTLVTTLAQNKGNMKILGVVISNALVALCGGGGLPGAAELLRRHGASGQVVFGLATVIIGISLIRFFTRSKAAQGLGKGSPVLRFPGPAPKGTMAVLLGSVIYKFCVQIAISAGLPANMLKFITAALFLVVLVIAGRKGGGDHPCLSCRT